MATSEATRVVRSTAGLIERVRGVVPSYAEGWGGSRGFAPTPTRELARLFAETRTSLREYRFESDAKGMVFRFADGYVMALDTNCARADRMFTIRHEFAHVLAGESDEPLFLTSEDTMSFSERRADLFAVADLTPTRWMQWVRGARRPWRHVELEVVQAYRELTEGWSEPRLWDRAALRVRLFREHHI